jgi:hypothetical protein
MDAVGLAAMGDRLYAVGGCDGQQCMKIVQYYDTLSNDWTMVAAMKSGRVGHCVVALATIFCR